MSCKLIFSSLTDYVKELLAEVMKCRHENPTIPQALAVERERRIPEPLTDNIEIIDKETAIEQHTSRFN